MIENYACKNFTTAPKIVMITSQKYRGRMDTRTAAYQESRIVYNGNRAHPPCQAAATL